MPENQAPTRAVELREMTVTVPNPRHDRRRRHGSDAVAALAAGSRFVLTTWRTESDIPVVERAERDVVFTKPDFRTSDELRRAAGATEWAERDTLAALLIRSSRPVAPTSWRELRESRGETSAFVDGRVLQRLFAGGDPAVLRALHEALAAEVAGG